MSYSRSNHKPNWYSKMYVFQLAESLFSELMLVMQSQMENQLPMGFGETKQWAQGTADSYLSVCLVLLEPSREETWGGEGAVTKSNVQSFPSNCPLAISCKV